ncbi:MAG: CdaR family protein [Paludibacteraceae bacterium]
MSEKNNSNDKNDFFRKIRERFVSKDTLIFLFFLVLSGIFWFVQSLDKQREATLKIPINYMGVPEDVEIENKLPKQVVIKISDEGMALMRYNRRQTIPLALDMDRVYFGKGEFVVTSDQLKNRLSRYVLPSTAVLQIDPDTILVKYHKLSNATLPIKVKSNLSFAPQYTLSNEIEVSPTKVKVFGPEHILDTMKAVYTERVELKSLSDTTEVRIKLETKKGVRYAFDDVTVKAYVEMFTENKKELPITIINAPRDIQVRVFPPMAQVTYNVGLSNFNKIKENDIKLVFNYDEAKESKRRKYELQVVSNSPFISNLRVSPKEVEFLLEEEK